jgi:hypothetical protein
MEKGSEITIDKIKATLIETMRIEDYWIEEEKRYAPAYIYVFEVEGIKPLIHISIPVDKYSEELLKKELEKRIKEVLGKS